MTFDLQRAIRLAALADEAYTRKPSVVDAATDTQVCLTDDMAARETVIAFRGTSDLRDWVTDASISLGRYFPGGQLHHGVHDAVEAVLPELSNQCRLRGPGQTFWFTGHSLGGAEAALAAYCLARQVDGFQIGGVITYAAPRWCDAEFSRTYNAALGETTWRATAAGDVIPHVPLPGFFLPYRHVGHEAHLDWNADLLLDRSLWALLRNDLTDLLNARALIKGNCPLLPFDLANNHAMARYTWLLNASAVKQS